VNPEAINFRIDEMLERNKRSAQLVIAVSTSCPSRMTLMTFWTRSRRTRDTDFDNPDATA